VLCMYQSGILIGMTFRVVIVKVNKLNMHHNLGLDYFRIKTLCNIDASIIYC